MAARISNDLDFQLQSRAFLDPSLLRPHPPRSCDASRTPCFATTTTQRMRPPGCAGSVRRKSFDTLRGEAAAVLEIAKVQYDRPASRPIVIDEDQIDSIH